MAEPHTTTTAAVIGATAAATTPLYFAAFGDWSWVVLGALGGATLAVSRAEAAPWLASIGHFIANTVAALMFARLLVSPVGWLVGVLDPKGATAPEHLLMVAAALTAMYWRSLLDDVLGALRRRLGKAD